MGMRVQWQRREQRVARAPWAGRQRRAGRRRTGSPRPTGSGPPPSAPQTPSAGCRICCRRSPAARRPRSSADAPAGRDRPRRRSAAPARCSGQVRGAGRAAVRRAGTGVGTVRWKPGSTSRTTCIHSELHHSTLLCCRNRISLRARARLERATGRRQRDKRACVRARGLVRRHSGRCGDPACSLRALTCIEGLLLPGTVHHIHPRSLSLCTLCTHVCTHACLASSRYAMSSMLRSPAQGCAQKQPRSADTQMQRIHSGPDPAARPSPPARARWRAGSASAPVPWRGLLLDHGQDVAGRAPALALPRLRARAGARAR
jgi:hypothetical protein